MKWIKERKAYFNDSKTLKNFSETVYFGLGIAFIITLIDIIMELFTKYIYTPKTNLVFFALKLCFLIVFMAIYGWDSADKNKKSEDSLK